jgi:hypothetical protein
MSRTDAFTGRHGGPTHVDLSDFHDLGRVLCPVVDDVPLDLEPGSEPSLSRLEKALLGVIAENQNLRARISLLEVAFGNQQLHSQVMGIQLSDILAGLKSKFPDTVQTEATDDE